MEEIYGLGWFGRLIGIKEKKLRKKFSAGVCFPRGFSGPSFIGAEAVVLRNGRMVAREVRGNWRGPWRRISSVGWKAYASRADAVDESRWGRIPDLDDYLPGGRRGY
jgi:hypothetical protein